MMLQRRCVTRSMTVSRWASVPAEMIASFHSACVSYTKGPDFCPSDTPGPICGHRSYLRTPRSMPSLVKIQLVCKAWYKGAGRGITALYLRSLNASPAPIFQTFTALITLRLNLRYVPWSDLQTVGYLVHLQHLHLFELIRHSVAEPQDRAFTRKMSKHGSPFSCLTGLRSLELELYEASSANPDGDGIRSFLQPISCMNNLQGFTLLGLSVNIGIQHLSQLSQLTSLGVGHVEDGVSSLVRLKHLGVAAINLRLFTSSWRPIASISADLVTLTNLRSLDCTLVQYCQVSHLTVLIALKALTIGLVHDTPSDHQSGVAIWSDLAELKHLDTLYVHSDAGLDVKDFQAIALLSCLTKLHFEGFTSDLDFKPENVNKLSALASLQYLYLEFTHSGGWCDAVDKLDIHLRALLIGANMQYFQVISGECDYDDEANHQSIGSLHLQPWE